LLLKVCSGDNGDGRSPRQIVAKLLVLLNRETSAASDPPLLEEVFILLVQFDAGTLFVRFAVEQATLFGEIDNLERLKSPSQLSSSNIGIDVQNLSLASLGGRSQDRQAPSLDGRLDGPLVNLGDLAHKLVLLPVQVIRLED